MAFETFSLGEIVRNAELINQSRRSSNLDILRGQALEENIAASQAHRARSAQVTQLAERQFNAQQQQKNTEFLANAMDRVLKSDDPVGVANRLLPFLKQSGIIDPSINTADGLDIQELQDISLLVKAAAGMSTDPVTVAKDATLVDPDTGEVIFSNFDPQTRIDEKTKERLTTESGLRSEFNKLTEDFRDVADSYQRVLASVEDHSPAGDLSLIFQYMKMLDPGSRVTEGEVATTDNVGNVPQRVWSMYNRLLTTGGRFDDDVRNDFVDRSNKLFDAALRSAQETAAAYEKIARDADVKVENVITVFEERKNQQRVLETPTEATIQKLRDNPDLMQTFISRFGEDAVPEDLR